MNSIIFTVLLTKALIYDLSLTFYDVDKADLAPKKSSQNRNICQSLQFNSTWFPLIKLFFIRL